MPMSNLTEVEPLRVYVGEPAKAGLNSLWCGKLELGGGPEQLFVLLEDRYGISVSANCIGPSVYQWRRSPTFGPESSSRQH